MVYIVSTVEGSVGKFYGDPYLNASKTIKQQSADYFAVQKTLKEVNVSLDNKTPWRLNIFNEFDEK